MALFQYVGGPAEAGLNFSGPPTPQYIREYNEAMEASGSALRIMPIGMANGIMQYIIQNNLPTSTENPDALSGGADAGNAPDTGTQEATVGNVGPAVAAAVGIASIGMTGPVGAVAAVANAVSQATTGKSIMTHVMEMANPATAPAPGPGPDSNDVAAANEAAANAAESQANESAGAPSGVSAVAAETQANAAAVAANNANEDGSAAANDASGVGNAGDGQGGVGGDNASAGNTGDAGDSSDGGDGSASAARGGLIHSADYYKHGGYEMGGLVKPPHYAKAVDTIRQQYALGGLASAVQAVKSYSVQDKTRPQGVGGLAQAIGIQASPIKQSKPGLMDPTSSSVNPLGNQFDDNRSDRDKQVEADKKYAKEHNAYYMAASGGLVPQYADGGSVPGDPNSPADPRVLAQMPPENTADNVPAKLSEGEYVMDAATVMFYGVDYFRKLQQKAHKTILEQEAKQQPQEQQQGLAAPPPGQQQAAPQQGAPQTPLPQQAPPASAPNPTEQRIMATNNPKGLGAGSMI